MSTWLANVGSNAQQPVYFIRFTDSNPPILTQYSTGPVRNAATPSAVYTYMQIPRETGPELDIIDGTRDPRRLEFEVLDVAGHVTDLLRTLGQAKNRRVTVYSGYVDMDEADYQVTFNGRITAVGLTDDLGAYRFELADQSYLLDGTLFANADEAAPTVIEGNLVNVWASLVLGDFGTAEFPLDRVTDGTPLLPNRYEIPYFDTWVDNPGNAMDGDPNTFAYLNNSASTIIFYFLELGISRFSGRVAVDVEALGGTATVEESLDGGGTWEQVGTAGEGERATITGSVLDGINLKRYAVRVHNGDPDLQQTADPADVSRLYTVAMANSEAAGLGVSNIELDLDDIQAQRDRWAPDTDIRVIVVDSNDAREFFEREFYRCFQCFPATLQNGLMTLRFYRPPLADDALALGDAETYATRGWQYDMNSHLNAFLYRGDENGDTGDTVVLYDTETPADLQDQVATSERIEFAHESRIMRSQLGGNVQAEELAGRLRTLFRDPPVVYRKELTFRSRLLEPGDTLSITDSVLPDIRTGVRGITTPRLAYVLSRGLDGIGGVVTVTIMEIALERYGVYADDAAVPHGSATDADRRRLVYLANAGTLLMGNGDPAYRWL